MALFTALSPLPDADVVAFAFGIAYQRAFASAVVASHGLLDAMTNGGLGVAFFWPLSERRCFLPVKPLPVAPIGARMLSPRGAFVLAVELVYFLPPLVYALSPRRAR